MKKAHKNWVSVNTWTKAVKALAKYTQQTGEPVSNFTLAQPKGCYDVLIMRGEEMITWAAGCSEFVDEEMREAE